MGKKWKDGGPGGGFIDQIVEGLTGGRGGRGGILGDTRRVSPSGGGKPREVVRGWGEKTGDAIKKGHFKKSR